MHYLSDVVGAWAIGITWLGLTAFAFELTRRAAGQPVTDPVTEGLEPEARAELKPTEPGSAMRKAPLRDYGRIAAGGLVAWVLILGAIVGIGELVTRDGNGNVLGDRRIPHWLEYGAPLQCQSSRALPRAASLRPIVRPRHLHSR
ncbi:MAG: hypothetical protein ACRDNT_31590 [Streptosporangiaceae bacterium]